MTRTEAVQYARELLGAPYHHQGFNRFGCDCVGLVRHVYERSGAGHLDLPPYASNPDGEQLMQYARLYGHEISIAEAAEGDVLVFKFLRDPQHFAILTPAGMIHAFGRAQKVIEHGVDPAWRRLMCAAFRFPSLEV